MSRDIKRGQPGNAGQFAPDTRGKNGPTPGVGGLTTNPTPDSPDYTARYAQQAERLQQAAGTHVPETTSIRQGMAMPGTPYTGIYIEYRNPQTGHVRIEWAGELHGTWDKEGEPDRAAELIAGLRGSHDGYLPYRAVLTAPHASLPNTWSERDVSLLNPRDIIDRVLRNQRM